jgi:hypothetical protein
MTQIFIVIAMTLTLSGPSAFAQSEAFYIDNTGAIPLPTDGYSPEYEIVKQKAHQRHATSQRWLNFKESYGEWYAMWNVFTGNPDRLWGEGYQLPDYPMVSSANAEAASRAALREFSEILRTEDENLHLVAALNRKERFTVHFQQQHQGVPVLLSTTFVKMGHNGRVYMIGCDYQPRIEVNPIPTLTLEMAKAAAFNGLGSFETLAQDGQLEDNNIVVEGGALYVLPYATHKKLTHHLVYEFTMYIDDMRIWRTYVDAHSGDVLWRFNQVRSGIHGHITASVHKDNVLQAVQTVNISGMHITVGGQNATTDASGNYTSSNSGAVTARLRGPYVRITNDGGTDAVVTATVANNGTFNLHWDDSNSNSQERNAFAHMMRTHAFIKSIDPAFTGMDYQVPVQVNKPQANCNAYWNGTGMGYYQGRGGVNPCANTAEMVEVVSHEYGHGINSKLYQSLNQPGMINGSLNEGTADVNACLMLDTPNMGVGFFNNNPLRNLDNTRRYPQNVHSDIHITGLIVGGAVWDMREAVGLSVARDLSHFAKYDIPNDPDIGTCFTQYLIAILAEDDNDNNLANGTPNGAAIVNAFRIHGIPANVLFSITHTPIENALASVSIPILAQVSADFPGISASGVKVNYRVKGTGTWTAVTLNGVGQGWTNSIPPQNGGTVIEYYFTVTEPLLGDTYFPAAGQSAPLMFPVGYVQKHLWDFETNQNWTGGIAGDNATTGIWERGDPVGTFVSAMPVQPEDDHTPNGVNCWFTGNADRGDPPGTNDVDDGRTTLLSPQFSLANMTAPAIRYWRWFSNDLGAAPRDDDWQVQISNNNGTTWWDIEKSNEPFNEWRAKFFIVSDYVSPSSTMRLRFIARDDDPGSLVEAAVDDVEILDIDPIPVELASLSANRFDNLVTVNWSTVSETNNYGFDVEYQIAGESTWTTHGFVEGHGTTQQQLHYHYAFNEYTGRTVYVRLKQMDFDGSYSYSPVVEVSAKGFSFVLHQNYPNPFNPSTRISFELPASYPVMLDIVNSFGQIVKTMELGDLSAGAHDINIMMDGFPSGMYMYRLRAGDQTMTRSMHLVR